jgi:hypothetical protein
VTGVLFHFRQYLWDIRSISANGGYHKGEELLLLLRPPSPWSAEIRTVR